jgi:RimJ/RimL family protein N-acetyltransferase
MHYLRLLANRDYSILLVYQGDEIVHRSCVFPRYLRFPFMSKNDLQIGDTWTTPSHRSRGLATFAIRKILELHQKPERRFWYLVDERNQASAGVVKKAGFVQVGRGEKRPRFGLRIIGAYVMIS